MREEKKVLTIVDGLKIIERMRATARDYQSANVIKQAIEHIEKLEAEVSELNLKYDSILEHDDVTDDDDSAVADNDDSTCADAGA